MTENNKTLIESLESVIHLKLDEKLESKLEEKLGKYPTKQEFYKQTDKLMKEMKDLRDEVTVSTHQTKRNTDEIKKIKEVVFN